ncbi:MAG: glycine zipper 2TM domain-containing protein [Bacillota bacterium]
MNKDCAVCYKRLLLIHLSCLFPLGSGVKIPVTNQAFFGEKMEISQSPHRIHPLVAGAAASVMLVCLLGAAAITGILPTSHGTAAPVAAAAANTAAIPVASAPVATPAQQVAQEESPAPAPVQHKRITHRAAPVHSHPAVYAQAEPVRAPAPVYQQAPAPVQPQPAPVAQNSPIGIGVGAVVGGLLGNQIGGGNGRTLATIAGAVGGGYIGNEIAKKTQGQ